MSELFSNQARFDIFFTLVPKVKNNSVFKPKAGPEPLSAAALL
jgi:hypothetical protein